MADHEKYWPGGILPDIPILDILETKSEFLNVDGRGVELWRPDIDLYATRYLEVERWWILIMRMSEKTQCLCRLPSTPISFFILY